MTILYAIYLCDSCMCLCVCMYIGRGPLFTDRSIPGGAHYMFDMFGMWYSGELTKLCAYSFVYCFGYYRFGKKGSNLIAAHTPMFSAMNEIGTKSDECF